MGDGRGRAGQKNWLFGKVSFCGVGFVRLANVPIVGGKLFSKCAVAEKE